jgi:hypothetical protein
MTSYRPDISETACIRSKGDRSEYRYSRGQPRMATAFLLEEKIEDLLLKVDA